jgi:hypothetical protein
MFVPQNQSVHTSRALVDEAERYLALIDLFRAEGREPHWRPEPARRSAERKR